jgi:hypothetical protein
MTEDLVQLRPPSKPEDYECCQRGCSPCIFDYYWAAMAKWEQRMRSLGREPDDVLAQFGLER